MLSNNKNIKYKNNIENTKTFGFWIYLMSDCIIFAALFATYAVLKNNTALGPSSKDIFNIKLVFIETCCLLLSSFTYNIAISHTHAKSKNKIFTWLIATLLTGVYFVYLEIYEFHHLIYHKFYPWSSAFLSSFFTIITTHGLHVVCGLLWIIVMIIHIQMKGLNNINQIRLQCLGLFWHFLDIIWICIFTIIYLMGIIE